MNAVMANDQIAMAVWHGQLPRGQAIDFQGDMLCIVWYILKDVVYGIRKTGAWSPVFSNYIEDFVEDKAFGESMKKFWRKHSKHIPSDYQEQLPSV